MPEDITGDPSRPSVLVSGRGLTFRGKDLPKLIDDDGEDDRVTHRLNEADGKLECSRVEDAVRGTDPLSDHSIQLHLK
jgi:hypothetical protein